MIFSLSRLAQPLTHRRSNGVLVSLPVARLIRSGDRARGEGNWAKAGFAYRAAVAQMPDLKHIWIQAGHAGKETGDFAAATDAYSHAAGLGADDPEPHIHLGHVAKLSGRSIEAAEYYFEALRRCPESLAAAAELMRTADADTPSGRALIDLAITLVGLERAEVSPRSAESRKQVYFDVTDLLAYFSHARLPTGIQRVQIELVRGALKTSHVTTIGVCCFSEAWGGWRALSGDRFMRVSAASLTGDDRTDALWRREVISSLLELVAGPKIVFDRNSTLVNVGSSWSERNYFLHLRNARDIGGPRYVPLIYDLIPMHHPEWFPATLVRDYRAWIRELFVHADAFFAISNATANDLRYIHAEIGPDRPGTDVGVIALEGDFRSPLRNDADGSFLLSQDLEPGSFVLMVSTIEPRKNHVGAFRAWQRMLALMPADKVPQLVCVGGRGWMNDPVHALLASDASLRGKVRLLHGVGDADLALLYQSCLFTIYPSFYEGWGLPVTESLCYGKVPAISQGSSMRESGGRFAIYFDPADTEDMSNALRRLIEHPDERAAREAEIVETFRPVEWPVIADRLLANVKKLAAKGGSSAIAPPKGLMRLSFSADPGRNSSGERLRRGNGWGPPGIDGAGILEDGAKVRFPDDKTILDTSIRLRLTVRSRESRRIEIRAGNATVLETTIDGNCSCWIGLPKLPCSVREITLIDPAFQTEQIGMGRTEAAILVSEIAFVPVG